MADAKKIALLVRDRKHEALRVGVGLTLADDEVTVFVMDDVLNPDEAMQENLEAMDMMDIKLISNNPDNPYEQMSTEDIAKELLKFDHVVPY